MAEYIERDALERKYEERYMDYRNRSQRELFAGKILVDDTLTTAAVVMKSCLSSLREAPAADVAPVRHGLWEKSVVIQTDTSTHYDYTCSECSIVTTRESDYCPNCGAKMDKEDTNED